MRPEAKGGNLDILERKRQNSEMNIKKDSKGRKIEADDIFTRKDDSEVDLKSEEERNIERMTVIDEINDDEQSNKSEVGQLLL